MEFCESVDPSRCVNSLFPKFLPVSDQNHTMSFSYINLPNLRESSDMEDVIFRFKKSDTNDETEVRANKTILSLASEVFKTQFFGSLPAGKVIPIEDSSVDAFKIFIDALYDVKVNYEEINFMLLGEIFFLAEKYQVDAVKVAITKNVRTREVNENDVLKVAKVSEANNYLVEFADALDVLCAKFVRSLSIDKLSELFSI